MNKKELIELMKKEIKPYAQPRGITQISKSELEKIYKEAQELGLTRTKKVLVQIGMDFFE